MPLGGNIELPSCPVEEDYYTDTDLTALFMKAKVRGIVTDDLVPNGSTGRIDIAKLDEAIRNASGSSGPVKPLPMQDVGRTQEEIMVDVQKNDAALSQFLQEEYCYYEARYRYSLKTFLTKAASRNSADDATANRLLGNAKLLNQRTNAALEIMNYLAQKRVDNVNVNTTTINNRNNAINTKMEKLRSIYSMLNKDNAIIRSQREMVRYTEEKNNYTTNQIALWTGLNVLALATIFYVYRN